MKGNSRAQPYPTSGFRSLVADTLWPQQRGSVTYYLVRTSKWLVTIPAPTSPKPLR